MIRDLLSRPFVKGLVGAMVGGLMFLAGFHAYFDHRALHDLVNMVNATAAKPK